MNLKAFGDAIKSVAEFAFTVLTALLHYMLDMSQDTTAATCALFVLEPLNIISFFLS